jgi:hypothetical protein
MSQSNYNIPNQSAPAVRAQLNAVFGSIATNNSGSAAPSTTFAYQWWYDTSTDILKMRNGANSAWVNVAYFDQAAGAFRILDDTQVVNTSGVQTGLLGDQDTATWEAGTGTTESLVSPAKVAAAAAVLIAAQPSNITLLGSITTGSGTTQTLSGLTLTSYKFLRAVFNGVAGNTVTSSAELRFAGCSTGIGFADTGTNAVRGVVDIDLATGVGASGLASVTATAPASAAATNRALRSSTTTASSSVSVTLVGGISPAFSGGSVRVYGIL